MNHNKHILRRTMLAFSPKILISLILTLSLALIGCSPAGDESGRKLKSDEAADDTGYNQILKGDQIEGYRQARPGVPLSFPEDHGEHPDYRIEWWYLTANLTADLDNDLATQEGLRTNREYGIQFTLFRNRMQPPAETEKEDAGWATPQIYMAHAALSTPTGHYEAEIFARGGVGLVEVQPEPFVVRIEDWLFGKSKKADVNLNATTPITGDILPIQLALDTGEFALDLELSGNGAIALHGDNGFSRKHPTNEVGSYYYSMPHLSISGTVQLPEQEGGGEISVSGLAWLDREWSSQYLSDEQTGWDWMSLHLDDGRGLMAFRLRQKDGNHYIYGSLITPEGEVTTLDRNTLEFEPIEYAKVSAPDGDGRERVRPVPVGWQVGLPTESLSWQVHALHADQQMNTLFPYWEGAVLCAEPAQCRGYLELTGY
ncbi:lipocalin-like domain-containing protein [Corallincola platygyrae]